MHNLNTLLKDFVRRAIFCILTFLGGYVLYSIADQFLPLYDLFGAAVQKVLEDWGLFGAWPILILFVLVLLFAEAISIAHCFYKTWKLPRIEKIGDRYVKTQRGTQTPASRAETLAFDNMQIIRRKLKLDNSLHTDLFVEEMDELNAYTLGMETIAGGRHAICLSSSLLETLPSVRVAAVIAHEMGHVKNQDSAASIFMGVCASLVSGLVFAPLYLAYAAILILRLLLSVIPLLGFLATMILFLVTLLVGLLRAAEILLMWPAKLYRQYVSRLHEYRADAVAARCVGPKSICQVLFLLSRCDPARHKKRLLNFTDKLKILHATHPSFKHRIEAVQNRTYAEAAATENA